MKKIVLNILDNVRTPERSRSPVGFYMTEQEQFQQNNPDVNSFISRKNIYFIFFSYSFTSIMKFSNKLRKFMKNLYQILMNNDGIYQLIHYKRKFYHSMKIILINKHYSNNLIKLLVNLHFNQ